MDPAIYRTGSSRSEAQSERMEDNQTPLSNQQLVQLIRSFILVEQGQRQEPRALTTDLKPIQEDLHLKKTNVYRSIPYSRLGSNRDAHCYRKAYPHLVVFKVSINIYVLCSLSYPYVNVTRVIDLKFNLAVNNIRLKIYTLTLFKLIVCDLSPSKMV